MMCARCEDLEEQVAYLRSELGLVQDTARFAKLKAALGLSPSETAIVARLHALRGKPLSRAQLLEALPGYDDSAERGENLISVYVAKIRGRLGAAFIETVWARGFAISAAASAQIDAILSGERAAA